MSAEKSAPSDVVVGKKKNKKNKGQAITIGQLKQSELDKAKVDPANFSKMFN